MMRFYQVAAAALLGVVVGLPVFAQAGPAERPPAGFSGQQYVDSRGCVFLRAGFGGQVQWVQRISSNRQPLCGYPPTFAAARIEMADEAPAAAAPAATVVAKPAAVVVAAAPAAQPVVQQPVVQQPVRVATVPVQPAAQPVVVARPAAPVARVAAAAATGPGPGKIGCYKSAPVPMVVPLRGGGTALVCTRGDGTMTGWRPPVLPNGAPVGATLNLPQLAGYQMTGNGELVAVGGAQTPPAGYREAWEDDRLNPERSLGTAQGRAAQDETWTQEVPAQQVAVAKPAKPKAKTTVSSNTNATEATGSFYVQVGTYGEPSNAAGAASRLSSLGLPTAKGNLTKNGKALQIVYAGPFGSTAAAQSALSAARSAGFSDAFIR